MKKGKRLLSILLVLCMLTGLIPVTTVNATEQGDSSFEDVPSDESGEFLELTETVSGHCGGEGEGTNLVWTLTTDGMLTISGTGSMGDYDYFESSYAPPWHDYADLITRVSVGDGVTNLGDYAFWQCVNLVSVDLPDTLTSIGNRAFCDCSRLPAITIPAGVSEIGELAFNGCDSLTSMVIPNGVTKISAQTFNECFALTSVTIPDSVTSIGRFAFGCCRSLTSISLPESLLAIGEYAFYDCRSLTTVALPNNLTEIASGLFSNCVGLTTIDIPQDITTIGENAFYNCESLTSITIPETVTSIGKSALSYCDRLIEISLPESILSIGEAAFEYCAQLQSISIPSKVIQINRYTFRACESLTSISIPASVTSIGKSAFSLCSSLGDVNFSGTAAQWNTISIDEQNDLLLNAEIHFQDNENEPSEVPVTGITLNHTELTMNVGDTVELQATIEPDDATDKSVEWISSNESVATVDKGLVNAARDGSATITARVSNDSLTYYEATCDVTVLPSTLTYTVTYDANGGSGSAPAEATVAEGKTYTVSTQGDLTRENHEFTGWNTRADGSGTAYVAGASMTVTSDITLYAQWKIKVPSDTIASGYCGGEDRTDIIWTLTTDGTLTICGTGKMQNYSTYYWYTYAPPWHDYHAHIKSVIISNGVTSVGECAFVGCGLTSVSLPSGLTTIGSNAFFGCTSLTSIDLPAEVTSIGHSAFENCSSLSSISLPEGITIIDSDTFYGCNSLKSISIPESVTTIWSSAFGPNRPLTDVWYAGSSNQWMQIKGHDHYAFDSAKIHYKSVTKPEVVDFDPAIYRAFYLYKNSRPREQNINRTLSEATPSEVLTEQLQEAGFDKAADAWKLFDTISDALSDPTTLADCIIEPKDLYSAVILNALEASVTYDSVSDDLDKSLKIWKGFIDTEKALMEAQYGIDIRNKNDFKNMSIEAKKQLEKDAKKAFKEKYPILDQSSDVLEGISVIMEIASDVDEALERIVTVCHVAQTNEYMKEVIKDLYEDSKDVNTINGFYLQLALRTCVDILDSSTEELIQRIIFGEVVAAGIKTSKLLIDELWKGVTTTLYALHPAIFIFHTTYKAGKFVTNLAINMDDQVEQYLKMLAILDVEFLFDRTYQELRKNFAVQQDVRSASVYLNALDFMFQLRNEDTVRAYGHVDILDKTLVNQICKIYGADSYSAMKDILSTRQKDYYLNHELALIFWIYYLEEDYPNSGLYESYEYLIEESVERRLSKEYVAACPIDVYVYDESDQLIASIVDGRVRCDGNITVALSGDQKIVRFYDDQNYRIEYVGTDFGEMDVTISEFNELGESVRTTNYYDVALENGETYYTNVTDEILSETPYVLVDKKTQAIVDADYDSLLTDGEVFQVSIQGGTLLRKEELFLETSANPGENLEINAIVPDGYQFSHWQILGGAVSIKDATAISTTFVMPEFDVEVRAVLKEQGAGNGSSGGHYTPSTPATRAETIRNEDGSVTTIVTDKRTGTVTATTKYSDGTVLEIVTTADGEQQIYVTVPQGVISKVTIPVENMTMGTVAVIVHADGTEEVVRNCIPGKNGLIVTLKESARLKIMDKSRDFGDVPANHTFADAIDFASARGIIEGYGNGNFGVGNYATSAATVTVIARIMGENFYGSGATMKAQEWAKENGIATGLDMSSNITRGSFMVMLWRAAGCPESSTVVDFADASSLNNVEMAAIAWAVENGVINGYGDGTVRPNAGITRGAMAAIAQRYMIKQ